jgi:signal transduction histidine kinase
MTFKQKQILGVGTALAVLILIAVMTFRAMIRRASDAEWVTHTHVVIENLDDLQKDVLVAESNERGYLITGDESYLLLSSAAMASARQELHTIRTLTIDNPVQQHNLDSLEPLVEKRFATLESVAGTRKTGGLDAASQAVIQGAGRLTMSQVNANIGAMEDEEHNLLNVRTAEVKASTVFVQRAIVVGNLAGFTLLFFAAAITYTEMNRRQRAESEVRELNVSLEKRVAERTAELARSNSELQQFAYVASHDLQEPLRMVASFTQLLAKRYNDKLGDDAREFIHYAVDGANRLQTLISDLLNYSRVGTHAKPLLPVECDAALDRVLASLKLAIRDNRATIVRDPLPRVLADEGQLCQLLQNLLTNAMKFHGEAPPQIRISAKRMGQFWQISVSDNGIGIAPEHVERIWVIFQRLHTKTEYPGTGIGLAICKKIAERHGGVIGVESTPEAGSTFYFTIPVIEENQQPEGRTHDELRTAVGAH